jgi:hypothetical protein
MKLDWLHRRTRQIVSRTLAEHGDPEPEAEMERLLIGDALVVRDGNHYRIEAGGDPCPALAESVESRCDCGEPLRVRDADLHCRVCGRTYARH